MACRHRLRMISGGALLCFGIVSAAQNGSWMMSGLAGKNAGCMMTAALFAAGAMLWCMLWDGIKEKHSVAIQCIPPVICAVMAALCRASVRIVPCDNILRYAAADMLAHMLFGCFAVLCDEKRPLLAAPVAGVIASAVGWSVTLITRFAPFDERAAAVLTGLTAAVCAGSGMNALFGKEKSAAGAGIAVALLALMML